MLLQFTVVVNLAIKADPDCPVFIAKRLLAGAEIDNAQPAMPQRGMGPEIDPMFIGPAMFIKHVAETEDAWIQFAIAGAEGMAASVGDYENQPAKRAALR